MINQIIEGIIQGITEFLPISSSGHIVLLEKASGFSPENLSQLQVALHLGTLLSIVIYYFNDIKDILFNIRKNFRFIQFVIIGTLPLIAAYLFLYDFFKNIHNDLDLAFEVASYSFLITGFILLMTKYSNMRNKDFSYKIVLLIGIMQCIAILPGISRSGITISTALILGVSSKDAAKFSFFLAIPAILGVSILEIKDILINEQITTFPFLGFFTSLIIGYVSLRLLIFVTRDGKLWYFSIYCFIIGLMSILIF